MNYKNQTITKIEKWGSSNEWVLYNGNKKIAYIRINRYSEMNARIIAHIRTGMYRFTRVIGMKVIYELAS